METEGSLPFFLKKNPLLIRTLIQMNPLQDSLILSWIRFHVTIPSTPRSSKCSLSFSFPHQKFIYSSVLPHSCHILPFHFYHPTDIWWVKKKITKLLIMQFRTISSAHISFLGTLFLNIRDICCSCIDVTDQFFKLCKITGKYIELFVLNFMFFDGKWNEKKKWKKKKKIVEPVIPGILQI